MYDWPEVQWAHDALWSAIAERLNARGIAAPAKLDRARPTEEVWRDPGLVLSQTCGWPFATRLRGTVQLVATPVYAVDGCEGPHYSSVIVARRTDRGEHLADFRGRRFGYNADDSLSGKVAFRAAMRKEGLDPAAETWVETGSHRESIRAVAEDRADIAAIDAVCWALARKFEPDAAAPLRIVARTPLRPSLPLIAASGHRAEEIARIRGALGEALEDAETDAARGALSLRGTAVLNMSAYRALADLAG
jgi:ABC-type phosphate/phosphonate transport system substrate-binding protein